MANVRPIPEGYTTITPSITLNDAARGIEFYKKAFGATERMSMKGPEGKVMHAELQIGNSIVMLSDEVMNMRSAKTLGGSPVSFYVYVENSDEAFKRAISAGGKEIYPIHDEFWGDRVGGVEDPFGYKWSLATHTKELSPAEIEKAAQEWMKKEMANR
ncbi:MAG TPA: VOC family protein [Candidatus Eisenbacteria bacterium]|nr:VOC family protein [Candidatus Eisenbacteria bacterium]